MVSLSNVTEHFYRRLLLLLLVLIMVRLRNPLASIDCSYETVRKVRIRDSRLGIFYRVAQLAIGLYVLAYNIIVLQAYLKEAVAVTGSVRLRLREPDAPYRLAAGAAPYCLGEFNSTPGAPPPSIPGYVVNVAAGTYQYVGGPGGIPGTPQHSCIRLDSPYVLPGPRELNAVLLPTYTAQSPEVVQDPVACAGFTALPVNGIDPCAFVEAGPTTRSFLRDVDFWTLLIDHSMVSSNGITRNAVAMVGRLVGKDGKDVTPCDAYAGTASGCPSFIAAGAVGKPDIVSMRTLLQAAGIESLDTEAGSVASLRGNTSRSEGKVLLVSISYSNYFAPFLGFDGTGTYDWSSVSQPEVQAVLTAHCRATQSCLGCSPRSRCWNSCHRDSAVRSVTLPCWHCTFPCRSSIASKSAQCPRQATARSCRGLTPRFQRRIAFAPRKRASELWCRSRAASAQATSKHFSSMPWSRLGSSASQPSWQTVQPCAAADGATPTPNTSLVTALISTA